MQILQMLFAVFIFSSLCSAAFVYGDIYSHDLEKLDKTVVRVEGNFSYQLVTEKANYSLFLPEGDFILSASFFDEHGNLKLYAQEAVKVGDRDQRVDLVLKPVNTLNGYLIALGLFLLIAVLSFWMDSRFRVRQSPQKDEPKQKQTEKTELDEDAKKVLQVLENFEKRATQKELKQALKFSDSKLSLILTELEQLGHIRKFKRGRANIVKKLN